MFSYFFKKIAHISERDESPPHEANHFACNGKRQPISGVYLLKPNTALDIVIATEQRQDVTHLY